MLDTSVYDSSVTEGCVADPTMSSDDPVSSEIVRISPGESHSVEVEVEDSLTKPVTHLPLPETHQVLLTDQNGLQVLVEQPGSYEASTEQQVVTGGSMADSYINDTEQQVLITTEEQVFVGDGEMLSSSDYEQTCNVVNDSTEESPVLISTTGRVNMYEWGTTVNLLWFSLIIIN